VAASQGVLVLSISLTGAGTFRTCPRRACPRVWVAATTTRTRVWDAGLELETIREYAQGQLDAADERAAICRRHLNWCLALVQPLAPEPPNHGKIASQTREHDNLHAALGGAIECGEVAAGLWLAVALSMLWFVRGSYAEGRAWLSELLALPGAEATAPARADAMVAAGHLAYCQGEYTTAENLLQDASALVDQLGDELLGGVVQHFLANVARWSG
jgi:hypothetical protein